MTIAHGHWIQTYTGLQFDLIDPQPDMVCAEDVAHALAHLCRYTGHCERFYSVAEHSVLVSQIVPAEYALQGLLHDATEAYVGDLARPLKHLLPEYQEIEARVWQAVAACFDLPVDLHPSVKQADNDVLLAEKRALLSDSPAPWLVNGVPASVAIQSLAPTTAKNQFLQRLNELAR